MFESDMNRNNTYRINNQTSNNNTETTTTQPTMPEGSTQAFPGGNQEENITTLPSGTEHPPVAPVAPGTPTTPAPVFPSAPTTPSTPVFPSTPTTPSTPVFPSTPTTPSTPVFPSTPTTPSIPIFPSTPTIPAQPVFPSFPTVPSTPTFPSIPAIPSPPPMQYYGQVRFLNASNDTMPVNITIDNEPYAINSRFGTITNYEWVADGFHTVTVRSTNRPRTILFQQSFPFVAGEKITMVLVDIGANVDLIRISDMGCTNLPYNYGCYRIANMTYPGSSYDLMLYGGETVFRNVRFPNATPYKQAVAGSYQFYLTKSSGTNFTVVREIPVIVIGAYTPQAPSGEPLLSFQVDIEPSKNYTSYIISFDRPNDVRVMTVED